jgi:hypothetical protein
VRADEDLRYQTARAARGLEKLRALAEQMAPAGEPPDDPIAAVIAAPIHYEEACIRFCDRAAACFTRALGSGNPGTLEDNVARLLGSTSLHRVRELLHRAKLAWEGFDKAKAAAYAEAATVLDVYNASAGLAGPETSEMSDIVGYLETVVRVEWPAQAESPVVDRRSAYLPKLNTLAIGL